MSNKPQVPALMFQGTGSDVGKSILVAGLCRVFADRGLQVRPFKPQNMSNNAAVTNDGGEIGRAQALQARAARVAPSVHMNPVLLKPESEMGCQVVVQGKVLGHAKAVDYYAMKPKLMVQVLESYGELSLKADLMLIEGAGSAAEINLRPADIANMGFAQAADVAVILVADIDRGGVIAQIVGTWAVLDPIDRARIAGFVINKFRGDPALFLPAIEMITAQTGWPCFGLIPFWPGASKLPEEDSASLAKNRASTGQGLHVIIPLLSRIANFDDFDPLLAEPGVRVTMVKPGHALPGDGDWVILPGTKSTMADLAFFRAQGWDIDLLAHMRRGGGVLGICGGYQMLGTTIADPDGVEGPKGETLAGLGLLEVTTTMEKAKIVQHSSGVDNKGHAVSGYEIHMGRTQGPDCARPLLHLSGKPDGAVSADGRIMGCYLHGLFAADAFRAAFLGTSRVSDWAGQVEQALDDLAAHLKQHIKIDALWALAQKAQNLDG